jgi:MazG family protein
MSAEISRLIKVMARLRDPESGCPWDIEQTFETIAPYTIEEAYEVAEAIAQQDMPALKEELGDLLLQVVYHSRMAEEEGNFDFDSVAKTITDKMIRRHPHVFGDDSVATADAQTANWETQKAAERAKKAEADGLRPSAIDGVPLPLPALTRAEKLTKRAARVGFDWPNVSQVFDKLTEEIGELRAEIDRGAPADRLEDELGDMLFCVANLARHLKVDPEEALRSTNRKFERRFRAVEDSFAAEDRDIAEVSLDEMEERWQSAKTTVR